MGTNALILCADPERILSSFLREDADVQAVFADRVYTVMPRVKEYPLLIMSRWGGYPAVPEINVLDMAEMQVDVYGDRKKQAQDAAQIVRAVLDQRLPAGNSEDGWVTHVVTSQLRYLPDEASDPERPRYSFMVRAACRSAVPAA